MYSPSAKHTKIPNISSSAVEADAFVDRGIASEVFEEPGRVEVVSRLNSSEATGKARILRTVVMVDLLGVGRERGCLLGVEAA